MLSTISYWIVEGDVDFRKSYVENNITELARVSYFTVLSRLNESLIMFAVCYGSALTWGRVSRGPILETVWMLMVSVFLSQARASGVS